MIGVRLLLDLVDITNSETIEKVHDDNHHEEQEDDKDESTKPVFHGDVWIIKLSSQHYSGSYKRTENGPEMIKLFIFPSGDIGRVSVTRAVIIRGNIVDQAEHEGESDQEGYVGEEDVEVGPENSGEHVDVEWDGSVGHYPHQALVQLKLIIN